MPNKQVQEKVLWCFGINDLFFHKIFCKVKIKFLQCWCRSRSQWQCWCRDADAEISKWHKKKDIIFSCILFVVYTFYDKNLIYANFLLNPGYYFSHKQSLFYKPSDISNFCYILAQWSFRCYNKVCFNFLMWPCSQLRNKSYALKTWFSFSSCSARIVT